MSDSYALENKFRLADGGGYYHWDNSRILLNSPKGSFAMDLIGNELAVDQFSFSVRYNPDAAGVAYSPQGGTSGKKLVYRCKPDFGIDGPSGTLEDSGWILSTGGTATIDDCVIDMPSGYHSTFVQIAPPVAINANRRFSQGDVLKIAIKIHSVSERLYIVPPLASVASVQSETGLFNTSQSDECFASATGDDVLTWTFNASGDDSFLIIHPRTNSGGTSYRVSANVEITGISINDTVIYGNDHGKIYLLKPKPAKEYLADVPYGTPCWWNVDGSLMAKGYVSKIERTSRYSWQITCTSGIGMLDERMHIGKIYSGETFREVFYDICPLITNGGVFNTKIESGLAAAQVYGWLPIDTARNNLHRLLFALGAAMRQRKNNNSVYDYDCLYLSSAHTTVPAERVALGGSVTLRLPATGAEVTEHAFSALESDEEITLYDNTQGDTGAADGLTVVFQQPMHDLQTTGTLTIDESGDNYAVVSGTGTLSGKAYTHSRTAVSVGDTSSNSASVKRVTDNCLVSVANSINVARRVLSFYQSAKTVKAKLRLVSEKCGDNLSLTDAWGEAITAFLSKMEVSVTSVRAAQCELIEGYFPGNNGNKFTNRVLITASGTWTVPAGVDTIRVVLIQGGTGGSGGWNGHDGWGGYPAEGDPADGQLQRVHDYADPPHYPVPGDHTVVEARSYMYGSDRQRGEPGGAAGLPGDPGKILVATKSVVEGEILTFTVGSGGAGGAVGGGAGQTGGETEVVSDHLEEMQTWSRSSADGAISEVGYHDTLGNRDYALPGEAGHAGGAGGMSDTASVAFGNSGAKGRNGESVGSYSGGAGGKGIAIDGGWGFVGETNDTASGGGGGGAAWGAKGGAGGAARYTKTSVYDDDPEFIIYSGAGGAGANAAAPAVPTYGCGGGGGNGGGSGGNVGGTLVFVWSQMENNAAQDFLGLRKNGYQPITLYGGGKGGNGSAGGQGGPGVAIIYY